MTKQREIAVPQMKRMLGEAAANQLARSGGRSRRSRFAAMPTRVRLFATLGVASVAAVAAVSAGALNRSPVAPQLSPAESGVKPGVEPGETINVHTPEGTVQEGVSPCIKSDPAGYSAAELEDTEWCFHAPGTVPAGRQSGANRGADANRGTIYRRMPDGSFRVWREPAE